MTTAVKPLPPHGKRPRYLRGCRCLPCVNANKRYCKQYRVRTIAKPVRIDATPIRQRLQEWVDQGYSQTQIGDAVGKTSGDISKLLAGQPTIAPSVAARILNSAGPSGIPMNARVDSTGTIRRGQALHAIGYPMYIIAAGVPMATNHLGRLLDRQPATVSLAIAHGMTALYKQLARRPGPSHFAVFNARRHGWHGPLAWDDIDDPNEQPEVEQTSRVLNFHERAKLRREEIEHLAWCGHQPEQIHARLNGEVSISTVRQIVHEWRTGQRRQRKQVAA
ncbi:hypothetical protein ACJ6WE_09225 [Streptomyces sp. MMS24-I31]|uniref:hypothetical protein n=1 Tax=Streptomyces sp. MMS24-I31 TaxID=3351563 RepID=UPI003896D9CC